MVIYTPWKNNRCVLCLLNGSVGNSSVSVKDGWMDGSVGNSSVSAEDGWMDGSVGNSSVSVKDGWQCR